MYIFLRTTSIDALLLGWMLQSAGESAKDLQATVQRLESEVSNSMKDPNAASWCIPALDNSFTWIPLPHIGEVNSIHAALVQIEGLVNAVSVAVKLIEQITFLVKFPPIPEIQQMRFELPRAQEALTLCHRTIEGVDRELREWRHVIMTSEGCANLVSLRI